MLKRLTTVIGSILVCGSMLTAWSYPAVSPAPSNNHISSAPDYSWRYQYKAAPVVETYRVRRNDTLSGIAQKFNLNWEKVYCANKYRIGNDPNKLQINVKLKIRESNKVWCSIYKEQTTGNISTTRVVSVPAQAAPQSQPNYVGGGSFQQCVIMAESGGDPTAINPSSGASGLYGFLLSTWDSLGLGYPAGAYTAPVSVQNEGFAILYARDGTSPWAPYDGC